MPTYMQPSGNGYCFRRSIPSSLRKILGKREIKIPLGRDYSAACRQCREEAVRSDQLFDQAKVQLTQKREIARNPFARYEALTPLTELNEELKGQLHAFWLGIVESTDLERRANGFPEDNPEEFRAQAAEMRSALQKAWRDGNVETFLPALHTTLMFRGYRLEMPLEDEKRLCLEFMRAALAGYKLIAERDEGEDPPVNLKHPPLPPGNEIKEPTLSPAKSTKSKALTLYSLFEYWRDVDGRNPKTIDAVEVHIRRLDKLTDHKPAVQLRKADIVAYRDLRLQEVKSRTVEKDISYLKAVLQYAVDGDKLAANPASGVKVPNAKMGSQPRQLDREDLAKIFTSPIYADGIRPKGGAMDASAWIPLLTLYTGARLEELCQLTLDDIKTEGAIHYLKIMDLSNDQDPNKPLKRLKNAASRRVVPLHSALIKAGFLDYVEHQRTNQSGRLFPALKPDAKYGRLGTNWSKWWTRWRREIGIDGDENVFHAFRHVFKTQCRTSKIEEQFSDALTGHTGGGIGRAYGKFELEALNEAIQKLEYPKLKLDWVWKLDPAPKLRSTAIEPKEIRPSRSAINDTKIYFDTEFSSLEHPELISLGAISASGVEFYGEVTPLPVTVSAFVQEVVVPLLHGPKYSQRELAEQFFTWLRQFEQPVLLCDSDKDIRVLRSLIEGSDEDHSGTLSIPNHPQPSVTIKLLPQIRKQAIEIYLAAVAKHLNMDPRQHHALVDAQSLRAGWQAIEAPAS